MTVHVRVPSPLQPHTGGREEVPVAAETVGDALRTLADGYPPLRRHLFGGDGRLRAFVAVFVNERDARELGGAEARVAEGDVLTLVPSIAGG